MKGITLDIADWRRPSPESAPVQAKAAGLYMICTLAKHTAERKGFQDALMLDYRGYVAEATGANILFLMKKIMKTNLKELENYQKIINVQTVKVLFQIGQVSI